MRFRIWHEGCQYKWHDTWRDQRGFREFNLGSRSLKMFDGKNNRLLDSFSFRAALITAVVALWSVAGYVLLAVA
jgi:hypothetical protein